MGNKDQRFGEDNFFLRPRRRLRTESCGHRGFNRRPGGARSRASCSAFHLSLAGALASSTCRNSSRGFLAERLNGRCRLKVREASDGDPVTPGTIFVARGNWHMEVLAGASPSAAASLHLTQAPLENHCRPAVDALFCSAAAVYAGSVVAVVLTGMGSDGLAGSRLLRSYGSIVLAQDQPSSTIWGMPGAVANAGLANRVLPLDAIGPEIFASPLPATPGPAH